MRPSDGVMRSAETRATAKAQATRRGKVLLAVLGFAFVAASTGAVVEWLALAGKATAPLATQLKAVPAIEQLIVPVGAVLPFVTVKAPCG